MQPETHPMSQASKTSAPFEEPRHARRMLLIQWWRRTALMVCLFLAITALLINALDPAFVQPSSFALVQSLLAFAIAVLVAVNFLTFRLRR